MGNFIHDDFLLQSAQAAELFHDYAENQPIIDYHCHLDPALIADDYQFENLSKIWLFGDHYKWRAMRTNGINEKYITGNGSDREKFLKWADTVPKTLRNPLYHWTHLELARHFDCFDLLDRSNADEVYEKCNHLLQTKEFSVRNLLRRMKVEVVCTTDDPIDDLQHHQAIADSGFEIKVLPTFRPDKACNCQNIRDYNDYLNKLEDKSGMAIRTFSDLIEALKIRHDYFHSKGCRLSDHGLPTFSPLEAPRKDVEVAFEDIRREKPVRTSYFGSVQNAILLELAKMDHEKGWVQQFHYGAMRNNNSIMFKKIGPDTGYDSIGDLPVASSMSRFFDSLQCSDQLAKTIVYNLNPADNHVVASMIGNFQDGSVPGKIQFGSGWWFLDQKDGMENQLNALSNLGLLSRFVGMLTDSRSFLSYPRHEYFRRILCNMLGEDMKNGLMPNDINMIGDIVSDISYHNAREYFGFYS